MSKSTKKQNTTRINETAREIWLAGLGAFSRAQDEGNKLFDSLVKDGSEVEARTRKEVNDKVVSLRGEIESRVTEVRNRATSGVQRFEKLFEDRIARVLARLGVPTADDIQALSKRVQELSRDVKALNEGKAKSTRSKAA